MPAVYTTHGFAFGGRAASVPARALYLAAEWWTGRTSSDRIITVSEADRRLAPEWRIARHPGFSQVTDSARRIVQERLHLSAMADRTAAVDEALLTPPPR